MKTKVGILFLVCGSLFFFTEMLHAQTDTIRYVHPGGVYSNDGLSWATATNRLQDAINDLRDYLRKNNLTSGSVYVAAGTYVPSESTESSGGSMLNTSFKIYSGIHVYGGFNPDAPESSPADRMMINGKMCKDNWSRSEIGTTSAADVASQWDLQYKTVLSGNHSNSEVIFTYDSIRGRFNTTFPSSSYHVVWFATNGKYESGDEGTAGHFRPLEHEASLDGCVISGGNAASRSTAIREHTAYGGGVYMVGNAMLRNCTVERCNATLRGGGIYMDGGGKAELCYVHTCQSTGVGVVQGYGGGVCIDHEGALGHSHITNCAARCGGGLLISHIPSEYPSVDEIYYYSPFATACVINNNTASAEGGGIYLAEGGTINHCTVTGNNCIGPDVTYYGRRHGRSGGIYIRNCGMIFNSVFWGNRCETNNDIQFASVRQVIDTDHEVYVYHSAFMNHDISDWTGVQKEMVFSLEKENFPVRGLSGNHPCFFEPTVNPIDWDDSSVPGAGVFMHLAPANFPGPRIWHLTSYSALDQKGVQVTDAVQDASQWIRHAHTDYGVVTNLYEPVSTLGALVRKPDPMLYAMIPPQGVEGRLSSTPIPTLFIDPNRKGVFNNEGGFVPQDHEGNSWDVPIKDIGEAIHYFRGFLVDDDGDNHHYYMPLFDENGVPTGDSARFDYVQILVKEGKMTTAGTGNYLDWNIRTAAVRVESHMRLYGGYPSSLTGTNTAGRNPRDYVTNITANITGIEGARGYANNSAHVIAMVNVEHTIVDGFTLSDANTHNVYLSGSAHAGGGVLINNSTTPQSKRIHMTGNQLRNCVITNCSSQKGAAVYVNGEHLNSSGYICYAELKMVNCVVRNNTADYEDNHHNIDDHGIITANGRAYIEVEHCDVVNNVGYPFKADNKRTDDDLPITCPHPEHDYHGFHGYIRVNNSIVFCNGEVPTDDRLSLGASDSVMSVYPEGQDYVFGEYNMFDKDLRLQLRDTLQPHGFFNPDFSVTIPSDFIPDLAGNTTFGNSLRAPLPLDKHNRAIFTRTDMSDPDYPTFVNPSRNVGHSTGGDKPLYGGVVSYAPLTTNPCVNKAGSTYDSAENYDRTDNCLRNRGGTPDIGAIENTDLPQAGAVIYVTPDGAGRRDGSSWDNAIAGNTVYRLYGAAAAEGDSIDAASDARLINKASGNPVLTTDTRYCGGFARKYEYPMFRDILKAISTSVERDTYIGGPRNGESDTTNVGTPTNTTVTGNWYLNGIIPNDGSYDPTLALDPRYPYGEMSGASRGMFRAAGNISPIDESGSYTVTIDTKTAPGIVASGQLLLTNERTENYVSGLQYAVEKASILNKTLHRDSIQVWVSAGKYTDYKGFVMRDSVSVYGGFPAGKFSAPGMSERRALMSDVVSIPKSLENADMDAVDYETILQISDVNPKLSNSAINPAAIKFKDDSAAIKWQFNLWTYDSICPTTTHYYKWEVDTTDVSATYMRYPDMIYSGTTNVFSKRHKTDKTGVSTEGGWSWIAAEKYVYQYWGDQGGGNKSWELVYANRSNNVDYSNFKFDGSRNVIDADGNVIGTVSRGMELSGGMSKMSAWQTMKNVPAGTYKLSIDLAAFYRQTGDGHGYDVDNENTGVTFYILASDGDTLAEQPVFVKNTTTPYRLRRYTFEFIQPQTGDLTIRLMVAPGTKATDPAAFNSAMPALADNLNRREVMMANVVLKSFDESTGEYVFDRDAEETVSFNPRKETKVTRDLNWKKSARTTLRKRVLFMPDVTSPVYGNGLGNTVNGRGKIGDPMSHYERVIKEGRLSNVKTDGSTVNGRHQDPNYKEYNNAYWDGFTIRHGFVYDQHMAHGGGAGVQLFEGGHLVNCIVTDNFAGCFGVKGAGVFCDGSNATIENCFILNNTNTKGSVTPQQGQLQGGGLFLYEGTCFNSLIANNYAYGPGGGLALCVGKFYNNTLAYNTSDNGVGGLRIASGAASSILFANSIIYGNTGFAVDMTDKADYAPFLNCYIQSVTNITKTYITHAINAHTADNDGNYGVGNTFYNNQAPNALTTPFAADVNASGTFIDSARVRNDFALRQMDGVKCINSGTEDFASSLEDALAVATTAAIPNAKRAVYRAAVAGVELPGNDVVYAKRVQDCQVDIGAYEFNAAYGIRPDTITHPGHAIFYATYDSPGGDASARSPENAACKQKFQLVLDAAGRYKYNLMTQERYDTVSTVRAGHPGKQWTVEVWLEGDSVNSRANDSYAAAYIPTRSTKHNVTNYHDNTLDYSFIIPRGVQVKGGYKPGYYSYDEETGVYTDLRDPLTYRTVWSGRVMSATGAAGQCFHVVTFTNDLFDVNEMQMGDGGQLAAYGALPDADNHRAVIDGIFIEDGFANSPDYEDRIGAAAVVTDFAHVRNCVVQNNTAKEYGGGLYLKPYALVSGSIIKYNTAEIGGGVYVEAPASLNTDSLAHIYTTTICQNTATMSAGGMWFDNTYARVNSTALWHNTANDNANVSGTFSRSSSSTDYPFNYCAVESRRLEGLGNIELSPRETEGVRWDHTDPFDAVLYYPIEMSSTLARSGMTYYEWNNTHRRLFPTLDTVDIAGIHRTRWRQAGVVRGFAWGTDTLTVKDNDFIEIGARAINKTYEINVNPRYVMHRLYVMHSELINSVAARALQDNELDNDTANMYRQMGSCSLNPFHRLGDALDYVIAARKANPALYRNVRFEIYVEQGTYYPYHDAYDEQGQVRMNTFLVPEATSIIGGINSRLPGHNYCQAGYTDRYTNTLIGYNDDHRTGSDIPVAGTPYILNFAPADSIHACSDRARPMRDYNLNSVIEPWEFERQTILSGNAVAGDAFTHIYHVITAHADSLVVGPQPLRYRTDHSMTANWREGDRLMTNPIAPDDVNHFEEECDLSIAARAIILDGLQISGGYANHLDPRDTVRHPYQTKTYFRGGGIFIDGNWKESFDDTDPSGIPNVTEPARYNIPLVVRNSLFTDNMAGNGGGIYSNGDIHVYSSHFTQNYSQGPMTELDQSFIPWTAGGCIATNAYCGVVNTLFDNNEARRGLYPINVRSESERIPDADARQGFGGVLSVAAQSRVRVANCHFMRNKAVAYSAIYNFLANNRYSTADSMQLAFNSIFWGNEVFDVDNIAQLEHVVAPSQESVDAFNLKYKASRHGVFHYDAPIWERYERRFREYDSLYTHFVAMNDTFNVKVTDKLAELRQTADSMEGLYFCSYRKTYGPTGMKPTKEGYLMTRAEQRAYTDVRQQPVPLKLDLNGDTVENYANLFTYLHGNNNVLINRQNNATDGPNFKQPSFVAGIDGYMQNADWLLGRMNLTTDQGWGHLKQQVSRGVSYYITKYTGQRQFTSAALALAAAQAENPSATETDVYPILGTPVATFAGVAQPAQSAMYNYVARHVAKHTLTTPRVPEGDHHYMEYAHNNNDSETTGEMYRISMNPRMGEENVYIDMGIYEYQYVQLDLKGNEIDTVWVATKTRGARHDGLTWETPTTDLQGAIELLMSSHNNHDKYVCLLGDDEQHFAPSNVLDNRRAFIITSNSISSLLPDSAQADYDYGINSLTFLGGYSFDVKDAKRDPQAYPTVIEMPDAGNRNQLNQLVVIEDMTRQMVQANWLGEYTSRTNHVIPVTFDGITFINPYGVKDPSGDAGYSNLGGVLSGKGGAAIYYRWQRQYEEVAGTFSPNFNMALYPDSAMVDRRNVELPKLTISNCVFMDNGARTEDIAERSPAVRVGYGGGGTRIVNSLFHSNAGAPVYARKTDEVTGENNFDQIHNPVVIVNSTFALNGGHLRLDCENSEVHNSLIWMDDLASDTLVQLQIDNIVWDKDENRNRVGVEGQVTNNAFWGCFQAGDDTYHNDPLTTENRDILGGPNFIAPKINATTSDEYRTRDFRLNPGIRTMNMADTALYRSRIFFREYPDETLAVDNRYWKRSNGFKSGIVTSLVSDIDLAAKPRLYGVGMERGAYECLAVLQRVLYVQPNLPAATAGDGSSWQSPLGQGQLQNAIDAAAVYTYLNRTAGRETQQAYVFVKGSYDAMDRMDLVARDGVNVYGSLPGNFNDTAWMNPDSMAFTNGECQRFVNYVRAVSSGVGSPDATPTRINSLTVDGEDFSVGFLLDGFVFSNANDTLHRSPLVLNNHHTAVRNCIITGNTVVDAPVVDIRRGLLYNSLLYADSAATLVNVGANGLLLNNTIVATQAGVQPVDASGAAPEALRNNIILNAGDEPFACFAPYMTDRVPYSLPAYLTANPVLAYQLHEHGAQINAGTNTLPAVFNTHIADSIICFRRDRDILGNPRKIGGTVDNGALETWRVEHGTVVQLTALTNEVTDTRITTSDPQTLRAAFKTNYGGNVYPHAGSVVYLMDSSAVTMNYTDRDFEGMIFRPGYMLLCPGASFYGNGQDVQMNYLAAEKRFVNQRYSMTAFPFNYSKAHITSSAYNRTTDALTLTLAPLDFATYQYCGAARSQKDYVFRTTNSALWLPVDTLNRTATEGYLMDFGQTTDTLLRFTAFAPVKGQYVYTETDADKVVFLTQYDHRTAGSGAELNFTRQEDMGWNMKGLPWLVSNYRTDTIVEEGSFRRQMFIPHVFYQMDGTGEYLTAGDQMYTSRSWDAGATMSMGNAFFTQTATTALREPVLFRLPYYGFNEKASRPILRMARRTASSGGSPSLATADYLTVIPNPEADKNVQYNYGVDGMKWLTNDLAVQVYLMDSKRQSRISLLDAAPTETDIPLGVRIPSGSTDLGQRKNSHVAEISTDNDAVFTFSLPEKTAFADYKYVWLIDYERNRTVNLLEQDYETDIAGGQNNNRFALRIGGFPMTDEYGQRQYVVFVQNHTLFIRGLVEGDRIALYTPSGQKVDMATAAATEWSTPLAFQTMYIVTVNDKPYTVLNL